MTLGLLPNFVNTAALRYFYEVSRYGSYQLTEEKIHIAASAIRRQIQLLEQELDTKLFARDDRKSLQLTPAGEMLLNRVRRAMRELGSARSEIDALLGAHTGNVRVGVNETVAREFLASFLGKFRKRYPRVTFEIVVASSNALAAPLLRGELDIIVGYALEERTGLRQMASFGLHMCITVHKSHALAGREFVRVADLVDETLIMPSDDQRTRQVLNAIFSRVSIKPTLSVTTNSFEFIAVMVAQQLGIGFQIRVVPGPDPVRPDVVYVPLRDADIKPSILACYVPEEGTANMAALHCLEALQGALQEWSAESDSVSRLT
jgi:DNA-binding transcriptional LysR family regulator